MGDIFICHTLYHVLIALVRALRSRPGKSTLVLSTCVPEAEPLRAKLLDTAPDLWDAVLIVDEESWTHRTAKATFTACATRSASRILRCPRGMCTSAMTGAL